MHVISSACRASVLRRGARRGGEESAESRCRQLLLLLRLRHPLFFLRPRHVTAACAARGVIGWCAWVSFLFCFFHPLCYTNTQKKGVFSPRGVNLTSFNSRTGVDTLGFIKLDTHLIAGLLLRQSPRFCLSLI